MNTLSVKLKFRPSSVDGKEGVLYYRLILHRVVRQHATKYTIFPNEWDERQETIVLMNQDNPRHDSLRIICHRVHWEMTLLSNIANRLNDSQMVFNIEEVLAQFEEINKQQSFFNYMQNRIVRLKSFNKIGTYEKYLSAYRSFSDFRHNEDIRFHEITADVMESYQAYLVQERAVLRNTVSFYMRILRAVYRQGVENGLVTDQFPFRRVYTGVDKTIKRALPVSAIKKIKNLDFSFQPLLETSRDLFLFSVYTRGMSFVDMAYLKKANISGGYLTYSRQKTTQRLSILWEEPMQEIVNKYANDDTPYLLPVIKQEDGTERQQYIAMLKLVNRHLKIIGQLAGVTIPLTTYCARHSWASAAKHNDIPIGVIQNALGHESEKTTQIYLSQLDTTAVDRANRKIIRSLF